MKKYLLIVPALMLGAAVGLSTTSTPAGACDLNCIGEMANLSEATVVVLEGDENAETVDWSGEAYIQANLSGTVQELTVGDNYYIVQFETDTGVE